MKIKLISLTGKDSTFATQVANHLKKSQCDIESLTFNNGEVLSYPLETVRGCDVYIIHQLNGEALNDSLMRVFVLADALRGASAGCITLVSPFLPYMRQDYKSKHRQPITARLLAKLLHTSGVQKIVTFDLHAKQSVGFFDMPTDNIGFTTLLANHLKEEYKNTNLIISTADVGGVERVKKMADKLKCEFVMIHKSRKQAGKVDSMVLLGDVVGKIVLIIDDMTDTGGTLIKAAETLLEKGAQKVICGVTHLFNDENLIKKLDSSVIKKIYVTDSIGHPELPSKFVTISLTKKIAEVIVNINDGTSINFE